MKFAALVSGGKDSVYSIIECIRNGHELVCCVHLGAPLKTEEESFMYQTAASNVVPVLVEECLGVPLILKRRVGKSVNQSLVYENNDTGDEVEDLYLALQSAAEQFPEIEAVSSGAILSTYQRVRIESVCNRLNLTSLSYLWRMHPQKELLEKMLRDGGIEAILVKTACPPGLIPSRHLKKSLGNLYYSGLFDKLYERYQFHYCGEGGEYESIVVDCPIYKRRLVLDDYELLESDDGVGELIIKNCHSEEKNETAEINASNKPNESSEAKTKTTKSDTVMFTEDQNEMTTATPIATSLPNARRLSGGLIHFSEIISPILILQTTSSAEEVGLAVDEALEVFKLLRHGLLKFGCKSSDVLFVHLYLSEISHFSKINQHYKNFFGTLLPPSRSCVAVGKNALPGGRRVMLDCMVQIGSGDFMRKKNTGNAYTKAALQTNTSTLREVLHVQSISHWAPVCVGPYSQVNTLRSGIHFIAGQIGLDPPTMKLKEGWVEQLKQCWTNLAQILDALEGGSLDHLMSCLLYISPEVTDFNLVYQLCGEMLSTNAYVTPGSIDSYSPKDNEMYGGYEDEGTWREMTQGEKGENNSKSKIPILIVVIPEMPVGALIEIEAIALTTRAASCLDMDMCSRSDRVPPNADIPLTTGTLEWNSGHDFPIENNLVDNTCVFDYHVNTICIGSGCAAMTTAVASPIIKENNSNFSSFYEPEIILSKMLDDAFSSLTMSAKHILHVRLYFLLAGEKNDGDRWRSSLGTVLAAKISLLSGGITSTPAISVIPVLGMKYVCHQKLESPLVSLQMLTIDPIHLETELWIHQKREYS